MTPNNAVRDEAACRNAANRSLLCPLGCLNFRVLRFTHPKGPSGLLPPKAAANTFCGRGPKLVLGEESATRQGEKYSEPSLRPQGGSSVFSLE
jgi:hypothetical protein